MYNGSNTEKGGMRMRPDVDEAMRYLGVRDDPGNAIRPQMTALAEEFSSRIIPRYLWCVLPLVHGEGISLGGLPLPGQTARRMLADCRSCCLLVCTLGADFDVWLRRLQARDMAKAVMLDALGSAYVEAACDAAEQELAARFPESYLTDRFSPGYGDLPLTLQPALAALAEARRVGVTVTDSLLMNPQKSVTALIGLADRPQMARIRGCAHCAMNKTCTIRKAGKSCDI